MTSKTLLFDLRNAYESLLISGPDAANFLQAQLPIDIKGIATGYARWTCWADAKGRVRAMFHVGQIADDQWVLIAAPDHQAALRKIAMFVLRAQVQLGSGPDLLGALHDGGATPTACLARLQLSCGRSIYVGPNEPPANLMDPAQWRSVCALAGEAQLNLASCSKEIPQTLGLREGHGFDLNKGCFPGQEIVSRVHYRGRPPRRLHTTVARHAPDDALFCNPIAGTSLQIAQSLRSHSR